MSNENNIPEQSQTDIHEAEDPGIVNPIESDESSPISEPFFTPRQGDDRVVMESEWSFPISEKNAKDETVVIPSETQEVFFDFLDRMPDTDVVTKDFNAWAHAVKNGVFGLTYRIRNNPYNSFEPAETSSFTNSFRGPTKPHGILRWNGDFNNENDEKISGPRAVMRTRTALGMGALHRVDLMHSGFSVYLDTPPDGALLRLDSMLKMSKINVGRVSSGAAFSNLDVFSAQTFVAWVQQYIYDTSLSDVNASDIWDYISIHDFNLIVWGIACAAYPTGFNYARAVMGKTLEDLRLIEKRINPTKALWIDRNAFNNVQLKILSSVKSSSSNKNEIKHFKQQSQRNVDRLVSINDNLKLELHVPTVTEWINSGTSWLNNMIAMSDRAFALNDDQNLRNNYLQTEALSNLLKQYGHWIKAIHIGNAVCDDPETITSQLSMISTSDAAREKAIEEIGKYVRDTTVAIVAVPTETEDEENKLPRFPRLLPIDPLSTFFTLAELRVEKIVSRGS